MKTKSLLMALWLTLPTLTPAQLVLTNTTNIPDFAYAWRLDLTNVIIPDTVTNIGWGAFEGCTNLTKITVGKGVATIRVGALATMHSWYGNWPLSNAVSVVFTGNAPTCSFAFDELIPMGTIYGAVPCNVTAYYSAETSGWGAMLDDRPAICLNPRLIAFPPTLQEFHVRLEPCQDNMVVEASANLADWSVVGDAYHTYQGYTSFSTTGYPVRFFRIRQSVPVYDPQIR
jgi:hypothetical protein